MPAQEKLLQRYAQEQQVEVVKTFKISESASGKQIRKAFMEAINYTAAENIPIIICEKIDRLTRTGKDATIVSDWVLENTSREVHCVKESFVLSHNTKAHENLVWDMKVAIARSGVSTSFRYTLWVVASRLRNRNVRLRESCEWPPSRPTREFIAVAAFGRQLRESDALRSPTPRQSSNLGIRFLVDAFARPQHLVAT